MSQSALGNGNGLECVGANVWSVETAPLSPLYATEDAHVGHVHGSLESSWSSRPSRSSATMAQARRGLSVVIVR